MSTSLKIWLNLINHRRESCLKTPTCILREDRSINTTEFQSCWFSSFVDDWLQVFLRCLPISSPLDIVVVNVMFLSLLCSIQMSVLGAQVKPPKKLKSMFKKNLHTYSKHLSVDFILNQNLNNSKTNTLPKSFNLHEHCSFKF